MKYEYDNKGLSDVNVFLCYSTFAALALSLFTCKPSKPKEKEHERTNMNQEDAMKKMVFPYQKRPRAYRGGIIQIHVTRSCDKSCFNCTQGSQYRGKPYHISIEGLEMALLSLMDYWGVVGIFGGNPAVHPNFLEICELVRKYIPYEQRGIWCNNPIYPERAELMRATFNPAVSNINVHLDQKAAKLFRENWPECTILGEYEDSFHSPVFGSMETDLNMSQEDIWEKVSKCHINQNWSAMIAEFRGEPRAWFCEIAGAQSILHQDDPNYPDTGLELNIENIASQNYKPWWKLGYEYYREQVYNHCPNCLVPMNLKKMGSFSKNNKGYNVYGETYKDVTEPRVKGLGGHSQCIVEDDLYQINCEDNNKEFTNYLN